MKQESNVRYILRLALTLLAICAVVSALLAGVNAITKHHIAAIKQEKTHKALLEVQPNAIGLQKQELSGDTGIVTAFYASGHNYAVEVKPAGFDGPITMMVGITDGKVTGIAIVSHTETPGLGAVASANTDKGAAFRDQFIGLISGITIGDGNNQIDALSGATISSQAIVDGVNAALACVANLG